MQKNSILTSIFLLLFLLASVANGQDRQYLFDVPLEYNSYLLLNDPDCPIQISIPKIYAEGDGTLHYSYTISNFTDSSVKSFEIQEFDAFENPSYSAMPNLTASDEFTFVPYDSFPRIDENRFEIKDLDAKTAIKFNLNESHKKIWIVIVTKVELFSGKVYDATTKYPRIAKFIESTEERSVDWDTGKVLLTFDDKSDLLRRFISNEVLK